MAMTRGGFLKLAAAVTGSGLSGLGLGSGAGSAAAQVAARAAGAGEKAGDSTTISPPTGETGARPAGGLDSQRFRAAAADGDASRVADYLRQDPALAFSRDERGRSVLALAYLSGRQEVAAVLRRRIAALDLVETALAGDGERLKWWLAKAPGLVNELDSTGFNAVHAAVLAGQPALLIAMTVKGADFNALSADAPRRTPLRLAAEGGLNSKNAAGGLDPETADELVDLMVGNGGDPNAAQGDGVTPLHAAAAAGRRESIRLLIWSGADTTRLTPAGETPLMLAERAGHAEAAALLRRAERLPRAHRSSRFGVTAGGARFEPRPQPALPVAVINEYVAVSHGSLPRMRELLALYPSLLLATSTWNELAVEAGAHTGFKDGVRLQLDSGAPCALPTAAMMGMTGQVRAQLDEDPLRIHECGAHNMPLMWFPAIGGDGPEQLEIARLLLDRGAEVNAHKRGQTALLWAARGGCLEMAALLLRRGADVDAPALLTTGSRETTTPLAAARQAGRTAMVELLRRHGARG
jgi:ankyrin repeat protein